MRALGSLDSVFLWTHRYRKALGKSVGAGAVCLLVVPVAGTPEAGRPSRIAAPAVELRPALERGSERATAQPKQVWLVETTGTSELYGNGLRVLNDFPARSGARTYPVSFTGRDARKASLTNKVTGSEILVLGDRAEKFTHVFYADIRRPMQHVLLNPTERKSVEVIEETVRRLCGRAREGERACFSTPSPAPGGEGAMSYITLERRLRPEL